MCFHNFEQNLKLFTVEYAHVYSDIICRKIFWAEKIFFRHSDLILGQCDEPLKNEVYETYELYEQIFKTTFKHALNILILI